MTDNGARSSQPPDDTAEVANDPVDIAPDTAGTATDPVEALAKEAAEARDRWLRAMAEMENLRRRTEREVADARAYGIAGFARDMVGIADNMRRALDAIPAELRETAETGIRALIEGVELTDRELAKAMEKHGVRRVDARGQKFDPNYHQAMLEIPDPSVPTGTVVQVMQDGYVIGERVLRPALVGVAKGGPRAEGVKPEGPTSDGARTHTADAGRAAGSSDTDAEAKPS